MNIPYVSLTLARQYVTVLVRGPRVTAALGAGSTTPPSEPSPGHPLGSNTEATSRQPA
jgi:hypothetical protein